MRYLLALALALGACGDNNTTPAQPDDGGVTPDTPEQPAGSHCIDRPTDLPRPSETLPCDMLPPGLVLP